jgi:octaprenyl-diphosphate synthase
MIEAFAGLQGHFGAVERLMGRALASPETRVESLIAELGAFHGKMLRPALVLLVAETLGGADERHQRLGAALEMIHTATLIHDDLIDDSDTRRGKPTAHVRFGNTTSVLLGDYFYTHAFHLVAEMGMPQVMTRLTATTNIVCRGELHQQCAARDVALTEDEYGRIIYGKTAALTELAGELGAIAGTAAQRQAAAAYGLACGMAFQIVDDCLDFSGDPRKVGKTLSTDIERGRLTLPLIRLLKSARPEERERLEHRLVTASTPDEVAAIRELVARSGALESALDTARSHVRDAQQRLSALPDGDARQRLWTLAEFIVSRDF